MNQPGIIVSVRFSGGVEVVFRWDWEIVWGRREREDGGARVKSDDGK